MSKKNPAQVESLRIMLSAVWVLILLTQQVASGQTTKEQEPAGPPPKYSFFTFFTQAPVAKVMYSLTVPTKYGQKMVSRERVLAQGRVSLPTNTSLSLDLCFDSLEHLDQLEQLYPCQVNSLSAANLDFEDKHMHYLEGFKELLSINLKDTLITDKSLPQIAMFSHLTSINLVKTNVTGTGFACLTNLHKVKVIALEGISLKAGTVGKLKPLLANLISFNIGRTGLTKEDAAILKELKAVRELRIDTNIRLDNECVNYLSHLTALQKLSIYDTSITDKCIPILVKLPNLHTVTVRDKDFWTSKTHKAKYGQVEFIDQERRSTMPADFFKPGN